MFDKYTGRSRRFGFVTMSTPEEANAAIESLNETVRFNHLHWYCCHLQLLFQDMRTDLFLLYQEVGGRKIKVNVTESFLPNIDRSAPEPEPVFVDSQYKVYVGILSKSVTTEMLKNFFSEKGEVLSATVSRIPGTAKSKGYGFVTFSSEEEVEAAVSTFNNAVSFFYVTITMSAGGQFLFAYSTSHLLIKSIMWCGNLRPMPSLS